MTAFLDLFAGIGGFALGAYWAGLRFDAHYFSEVDPYATEDFQRRFPDAIPLGDIREIDGKALVDNAERAGRAGKSSEAQAVKNCDREENGLSLASSVGGWLLAGGFPCQDISCAGKGAGITGKRSGLWFEYARLIGEIRPRVAVMENVGALTRRGIDAVLGSLAEIGYDAEWADIRASDVGAPHRRERIWIVAYPHPMHEPGSPKPREQFNRTAQSPRSSSNRLEPRQNVADSNKIGGNRSGRAWDGRVESANGGKISHPDSMRMEGPRSEQQTARIDERYWSNWWSTEPDVGRVAHGVPSRVDRLKCLGNSIIPQIAYLIFMQPIFDRWLIAREVGR